MRTTGFRILMACALLAASHVAMAGAQMKYGVTVLTLRQADLAKARTYGWTVAHPSPDKNIDRMIVAAVDRELAARGLTKVPSGPSDLVVSYDSLQRTDVDLKAKPTEAGTLRDVSVGTLVVDLRGPDNKQSFFRVRMDTPIDRPRAEMEAPINGAVTAMFEKYPSPSKR